VTICMVKKCGSGGGQSIQLSVRRREILKVAPASGGFHAASRRMASADAGIILFE